MTGIFNFFGSILGYLLWALYYVFQNYGVAIIFFTIITKLLMFPLTLKQQKSMASQSKLSVKQKELQAKYGSNRQKYNEELQKLYEKEGVNPSAGCLTSLLPFPIMLGIFYSVVYPLSNTLHIASESITVAKEFIGKIPGMIATSAYPELEIIKNFQGIREYLNINAADMDKIDFFSNGFSFLGLDLMSTPQGSDFMSFLWLIPVLSLVSSFAQQLYMQRNSKKMGQPQQQGCMKVMMYVFPLISVYWAFIMPAAVGFYWVISSLVGFGQTLINNKFFSVHHVTAKSEAQRAVTLELAEGKLRPLPVQAQMEIASQLEAAANTSTKNKDSKQKNKSKKNTKKSGNSSNSNNYRGNKK